MFEINEDKKLPAPEDITAEQTRDVLAWLLEHGTITSFEAFVYLRCTRLSARIWDLRDLGYNIGGQIQTKNEDGKIKRWKEYRLEQ